MFSLHVWLLGNLFAYLFVYQKWYADFCVQLYSIQLLGPLCGLIFFVVQGQFFLES